MPTAGQKEAALSKARQRKSGPSARSRRTKKRQSVVTPRVVKQGVAAAVATDDAKLAEDQAVKLAAESGILVGKRVRVIGDHPDAGSFFTVKSIRSKRNGKSDFEVECWQHVGKQGNSGSRVFNAENVEAIKAGRGMRSGQLIAPAKSSETRKTGAPVVQDEPKREQRKTAAKSPEQPAGKKRRVELRLYKGEPIAKKSGKNTERNARILEALKSGDDVSKIAKAEKVEESLIRRMFKF